MEMNLGKIILTIAIPTYNGAGTLQETLDSLVTQLQSSVEILISDNASTDETADIVSKYQAKYPHIRYRQNPVNVGPMKNYDMCVEYALGEYVWLFGDDDKMSAGCIKKVLDVIRRSDYRLGFISISADIYGVDWTMREKNPLGLTEDIRFDNVGSVFAVLKDHIGLTPTIIVRRDSWLRHLEIRKLTDDYWFHVRMVLAIAEDEESYFVASPPIMFNQAYVRWNENGLFLRIVCEYCEMVLQLSDSMVGYKNKMDAIDRWYRGLWTHIVIAKREGWVVALPQILRLIKIFNKFPRFWLVDLPLLFTPRWVIQILLAVRKSAKRS